MISEDERKIVRATAERIVAAVGEALSETGLAVIDNHYLVDAPGGVDICLTLSAWDHFGGAPIDFRIQVDIVGPEPALVPAS